MSIEKNTITLAAIKVNCSLNWRMKQILILQYLVKIKNLCEEKLKLLFGVI